MNYADIISVTENRALFSWQLERPGFAELHLDGRVLRSAEAAGVGRFEIGGLTPDTAYTAELAGRTLAFRTLPDPGGTERFRFAVIADPHISGKTENRKGRLMVESAGLFADALHQAKACGAAFAVSPGDLTNEGTAAEYECLAEILRQSPLEVWCLPGNHDRAEDGLWEKLIGERRWRKEFCGMRLLGIDTADAMLHEEDARRLRDELAGYGRTLLFTHYQLFENPRLSHRKQLGIRNPEAHAELLAMLAQSPSLIFAGHQNICAVQHQERCIQLNLAQIVQFPCCFQLVRVFSGGMAIEAVPIRSEVLRQWSRTAGDLAAGFYTEPQWESAYRLGTCGESNLWLNFVSERKGNLSRFPEA